MSLAAALIYWVIVVIWLTVLGTIVYFYIRNPRAFGTTRLLLAVLCIDAIRNIAENIYFGLYFGSRYGFLTADLANLMGQPVLVIVPKVLNVVAGSVVLGLLLFRWLPLAIKERGRAEQRASDLETLAAIDFLTGVYNRRHFEGLARVELARCQRYVRPLSVLMIDIDHFKAVNDAYGHAAGDLVLKNVVAICRAEKRDPDLLARVGGEEFAMMLPETTEAAAAQFAERLRREVAGTMPTVYGEKLGVTISIGVAGATIRTLGVEALLRCADRALYEAKRSGRDRVVVSKLSDADPDLAREAAE
jgi:diguanylate cyclase (GGDEF)-like protein